VGVKSPPHQPMYPYHRDINGVQGLHSSAATVLQHLQPVRRILVSQCFPNRWETSIAMGSGAGFLVTVVLGAGPCPCITVAATLPLAGFLRSSPAVSVCVCLSLSVCLCVPLLSPAVPTVSLLLCARYIFIIIRVINRFRNPDPWHRQPRCQLHRAPACSCPP